MYFTAWATVHSPECSFRSQIADRTHGPECVQDVDELAGVRIVVEQSRLLKDPLGRRCKTVGPTVPANERG